jgi:hypothetical protein
MTSMSVTQVLLPSTVDPLRLAAAAYLAQFKGQSRVHTNSDLRAYLLWCAERGLDPLAATRPHIELLRAMGEPRLPLREADPIGLACWDASGRGPRYRCSAGQGGV